MRKRELKQKIDENAREITVLYSSRDHVHEELRQLRQDVNILRDLFRDEFPSRWPDDMTGEEINAQMQKDLDELDHEERQAAEVSRVSEQIRAYRARLAKKEADEKAAAKWVAEEDAKQKVLDAAAATVDRLTQDALRRANKPSRRPTASEMNAIMQGGTSDE